MVGTPVRLVKEPDQLSPVKLGQGIDVVVKVTNGLEPDATVPVKVTDPWSGLV
jgi:hypothetical protein